MAFSPDGSRVAFATKQGNILNLQPGSMVSAKMIHSHEGAIRGVAFSRDGTRLVTVGDLGPARVFEAFTGDLPVALEKHRASVWGLALHPSGEWVVSHCADSVLRWFEASSGRQMHKQVEPSSPLTCQYDPTGERLVTGNADGTISLRDGRDGQLIERRQVSDSAIALTEFAPGGDALLVACTGGAVRLLDAESLEPIWVQPCSPVELGWDRALDQALTYMKFSKPVVFGAFSSDGDWFALAEGGNRVTVRRRDTGAVIRELDGHESPLTAVCVNPADGRIASASLDGTVRIEGLGRKGDVVLRKAGDTPMTLAFGSSGEQILVGYASGHLRLWDSRSGLVLLSSALHDHPMTWVSFSPDEEVVWATHACGAVGGLTSTLELARQYWNAEAKQGRLSALVREVVVEELVPVRVERVIRQRLADDPESLERALGISWVIPLDPLDINNRAWEIVDPDGEPGGDLERALDYARYVIEQEPEEPNYLDTHAWACYQNGLYDEALESCERALEAALRAAAEPVREGGSARVTEEELEYFPGALERMRRLIAERR
jgi:WD40 repeat protein